MLTSIDLNQRSANPASYQAQADSVFAIHLQRLGFRLLFGYSNEGELCRILVAPQKIGLLRRLLLRMMAKIARNTIEDKGAPKTL
ncbi:hypothetical protein [Photobacterium profundum]|uniref:Uncharacterized protein n=1 Tax=Photobacterium profundum (strain SS9) TaxID=298386 RepID=Q6LK26_PHOPR|nr:hypothetical protein [Photobacterium profundum]CAG22354.1 hypothetical protein PBPRB0481 [Photobacterium profundum SS9]